MTDDDNDNNASKWNQHATSMSTKRTGHAAVKVDEYRALITGGVDDDNHILSSAEMFESSRNPPQTNMTMTPISNMSLKRHYHASIYCDDYVYVIGGFDLKSIERISVNNTTTTTAAAWEDVPSMNEARGGCSAALHNKTIYVFGGFDKDKTLSAAELYDTTLPNEQGWKAITSQMKQPRCFHCAATVGDEIFLMGGYNNDNEDILDSVEVFNTSDQSFRDGLTMPMPLANMSAVVRGRYILLCGGMSYNNRKIASSILFDTESMSWSIIDKHLLNEPRAYHASALLGDIIHVFGGSEYSSNTLNPIEYLPFTEILASLFLLESSKNQNIGISDTPNDSSPDRLGYTTYAKALVSIAQKVEGPKTSFCVSLNAPWGAGKSFLCKLIKGQLQNDEKEAYKKQEKEEKPQQQETKYFDDFRSKQLFEYFMKTMNIEQMKKILSSVWSSPMISKPFYSYILNNVIILLVLFIPFVIIMLAAFLVGSILVIILSLPLLCWDILKVMTVRAAKDSFIMVMDAFIKIDDSINCPNWLVYFIVFITLPIWFILWVPLFILSIANHILSIANHIMEYTFEKLVRPFLLLMRKALAKEDSYPKDENDLTKYIIVDFNTWDYNKSDQLWTSLFISIWEAIEDVYGPDKLSKYRSSVELERYKNGKGNNNAIDAESLYQKRVRALSSFKTKTLLSALVAVTTSIGAIVKVTNASYNDNSLENLHKDILFVSTIVVFLINLLFLTKQLYIFVVYVLPKPMVLQIRDKASSQREKYLGDTGYNGFVKDEFDFILDFLRFTPFPDQTLKRTHPAHLSIFIDDLDRCDGNTVMEVLAAVILLLVDAPVTCWLALDTRIVVATIEQEKKEVLEQAGISGYDYMEKIVQLPFCIPDLKKDNKLNYVSRLFLQGELDEVKLVGHVKNLQKQFYKDLTDPLDAYVMNDANDYEDAMSYLVNRMEHFISLSLNENYYGPFDSRIITDPKKVIDQMSQVIKEEKWKDIDDNEKEDFMFLVCEWIEWFQESRTKLPPTEYDDGSNPEGAHQGPNSNDLNLPPDEEEENQGAITIAEETPSLRPQEPNDGTGDIENQKNPPRYTPPLKTMVTYDEKLWFERNIDYMNGTGRTMKRIMNLYNVARYLVITMHPKADNIFRKKLLQIIILCEQWPYRMSWLMQIAEDITQESALKKEKQKTDGRSKRVFEGLQYLGFKIVRNGMENEQEDDEKQKTDDQSQQEVFLGSKIAKNGIDNEQGDDEVDTAAFSPSDQEKTCDWLCELSLFDIYHLVVESLLHAPDNAKKSLSRDGDPQVFEQLLAEQEDNKDCQLKLIDIALPGQFKDQHSRSNLSLRPFMINMSRHMIETAASYMEGCVIHENTKYKGDAFGPPRLLIEPTKSYYEKGKE